MEVTANVLLISRALLDVPDRRRYGYELMRVTSLAPASMYEALHRMQAAGWLTSYLEAGNPQQLGRRRRRYYHLTDQGLRCTWDHLRDWTKLLRGVA